MRPSLTVAIPTYNDYRGLSMTIQNLGLNHNRKNFEVIVFDNFGKCKETDKFCKENADRHIVDFSRLGTCYAKNQAINHSYSDYVLVIDSHVNLIAGCIEELLDYLANLPPDNCDIFHGLLFNGMGNLTATEIEPIWDNGMWGKWKNRFAKTGEISKEPFEVFGHGGAVFCVKRNSWYGFHPATEGFGGEEGIIQEIYRERGGKALSLPFLRWTHSFNSKENVSHIITNTAKFSNYMWNIRKLNNPKPIWSQCILHFSNLLSMNEIKKVCAVTMPGLIVEQTIRVG